MYGYNTDNYSTSIKEVADYIVRKLDYGTDIRRSLENKMNTGTPVTSRTIRTEADRALYGDHKFIWGNNIAEYFKHETKLDEN